MRSINDRENKLFEKWQSAFDENCDTGFCADGLIFNGMLWNEDYNRYSGNQEELWNNAKRKVLFFMKEANKNAGQDYREWGLYQKTSATFFRLIYSWLNGLSSVTSDSAIPSIVNELDIKLPLCIVNAKKQSGTSKASYDEIYSHVGKYGDFLRQQFDIYSPNIVVCGGSYKMANIARSIYDDIEFTQMENSNWIWYSIEKKMILIDSFHTGAHMSDVKKYNPLIEHFQKFLKLKLFDL